MNASHFVVFLCFCT